MQPERPEKIMLIVIHMPPVVDDTSKKRFFYTLARQVYLLDLKCQGSYLNVYLAGLCSLKVGELVLDG